MLKIIRVTVSSLTLAEVVSASVQNYFRISFDNSEVTNYFDNVNFMGEEKNATGFPPQMKVRIDCMSNEHSLSLGFVNLGSRGY